MKQQINQGKHWQRRSRKLFKFQSKCAANKDVYYLLFSVKPRTHQWQINKDIQQHLCVSYDVSTLNKCSSRIQDWLFIGYLWKTEQHIFYALAYVQHAYCSLLLSQMLSNSSWILVASDGFMEIQINHSINFMWKIYWRQGLCKFVLYSILSIN